MRHVLVNLSCLMVCMIYIFCTTTSCKYFKRINHDYSQNDIDKIKFRIAHFGDYSLNNEDIILRQFDNYYIGYAKYQDRAYFVGYISRNNTVKVIRVFNKKWQFNLKINESLISANITLDSFKLHFDTIDGNEENDSLDISIETNNNEPHSIWRLKNISDIKNFDQYVLRKSFIYCPQNLGDLIRKPTSNLQEPKTKKIK